MPVHKLYNWLIVLYCCALQNQPVVYASFLVFEICVGIFWPSVSTMRSKYIPEASMSLPHANIFLNNATTRWKCLGLNGVGCFVGGWCL